MSTYSCKSGVNEVGVEDTLEKKKTRLTVSVVVIVI